MATGTIQVDRYGQNNSRYYNIASSGTVRNDVIHSVMVGVRNELRNGETATMNLTINGTQTFGVIVKATANVIFGNMHQVNSTHGFFFRDSSADATATSTDF